VAQWLTLASALEALRNALYKFKTYLLYSHYYTTDPTVLDIEVDTVHEQECVS